MHENEATRIVLSKISESRRSSIYIRIKYISSSPTVILTKFKEVQNLSEISLAIKLNPALNSYVLFLEAHRRRRLLQNAIDHINMAF